MFGTVALGVALVAVSSRSERAMFQSGLPMPGVFATIGTELAENPRRFLRDSDPSAFFARLDPGVDEPAPAGEEEGLIAPIEQALMFVGPDEQLPAAGPIEIEPLDGLPDGPQLAYRPDSYRAPEAGDSPYSPISTPDRSPQPGDIPTPGGTIPTATPVPEPATWAMMLVGLMMVGSILRSRRSRRGPMHFAR